MIRIVFLLLLVLALKTHGATVHSSGFQTPKKSHHLHYEESKVSPSSSEDEIDTAMKQKSGKVSPASSTDSNDTGTSTQPLTISSESFSPAETVVPAKNPKKSWHSWITGSSQKKKKERKVVPVIRIPNARAIVENLHDEIYKLISEVDIPNPEIRGGGLPFLGNRGRKSVLLIKADLENVKERLVGRIDGCIRNAIELFASQPKGIEEITNRCIVSGFNQESAHLQQIKYDMLALQ